MTDPVDTDALRNPPWSNLDAIGGLLDAAADNVDRLRKDLGTQQRVNADLVRAWDYEYDKVNGLRTVIQNAPHDRYCGLERAQQRTDYCNCWKADAL